MWRRNIEELLKPLTTKLHSNEKDGTRDKKFFLEYGQFDLQKKWQTQIIRSDYSQIESRTSLTKIATR